MKARTIQSKWRYLLAFLIATFIFINGFFFTYYLAYLEFQRISDIQGSSSYEIFQNKLEISLFEEDICPLNYKSDISKDLGFQGRIIDDLEKKFGKNDEKVLFRKKFYTLIELEHFEFIKTLKERCGLDIDVIFFFYSNEDEDIEESENVGRLLTGVYERNENLIIYSFDINLESVLIDKLKEKYGVVKSPTAVLNEVIKVEEINNIEDIEKHLEYRKQK